MSSCFQVVDFEKSQPLHAKSAGWRRRFFQNPAHENNLTMSNQNKTNLRKYLHDANPCLLETVNLSCRIFNEADEDQRYDLAVLVLDHLLFEKNISTCEIAKQCLHTATEKDDLEFASLALFWVRIQNELDAIMGPQASEVSRDVAEQVRAASGSGRVAALVENFVKGV